MRVTLLPAAGASSRMRGGDKLMELVNGEPILAVLANRALVAKSTVIVTLPASDHPRAKTLASLDVNLVFVPNSDQGMSHSLRAGVAAAPQDATGVMILPADMPEISAQDIADAWEHYEKEQPIALQCTTQTGARGHPIIFSPKLLREFETLSGDRGAFALLNAHEADMGYFPLAGDRARLDLDTPEDWRDWRASLGRK